MKIQLRLTRMIHVSSNPQRSETLKRLLGRSSDQTFAYRKSETGMLLINFTTLVTKGEVIVRTSPL